MPGASTFQGTSERYYAFEMHSRNIPAPSNSWTGVNIGGYRNSRVDGLLERMAVTISLTERIPIHRELVREQIGDVAFMPLYWIVDPILAVAGAKGIKGRGTWNFIEWDRE